MAQGMDNSLEKLFANKIFRAKFDKSNFYPESSDKLDYLNLRERQNLAWAREAVRDGIKLLSTDTSLSMKKYAQALEIAPNCPEALVARGALLANTQQYKAATKDFKAALKIEPECANAAIYLKQTEERLDREKELKKQLKRGEFVMPQDDTKDLISNRVEMFIPIARKKSKNQDHDRSSSRKRKHAES